MKVASIGATGFVGSAILKEALDRGHADTAVGCGVDYLEWGVNADETIQQYSLRIRSIRCTGIVDSAGRVGGGKQSSGSDGH